MKLSDLVPPAWRALAGGLVAMAVMGALLGYRLQLIDMGRKEEAARHAQADAERARVASAALTAANAKVADRQAALDAALLQLADRGKELYDQQTRVAALQSALAAGRVRLPVAATCPGGRPAGTGQDPAAAGLDPQPAPAAELDPAAAGRLVQLTGTGDDAIIRLNACIAAYDAAAKAAGP
jgi:hypothetical protein